jgi:hypothetical protein
VIKKPRERGHSRRWANNVDNITNTNNNNNNNNNNNTKYQQNAWF